MRAACGLRKGRCKGDEWDLTALGEQHKKVCQSCVALWDVGEETCFPTNTVVMLCMALGKVPRQPTGSREMTR